MLDRLRACAENFLYNNIRVKLVITKIKDRWLLYSGILLFSKELQDSPNKIVYKKSNVIIAVFHYSRFYMFDLIGQLNSKESEFDSFVFSDSPIQDYKIYSKVTGVSENNTCTTEADKYFGYSFPLKQFNLILDTNVDLNAIKIGEFRSAHDLINRELKFDLDFLNALQNRLIFQFEKYLGKIIACEQSGSKVVFTIDFDETLVTEYSLSKKIYYSNSKTAVDKISIEKRVEIPFNVDVALIELFLSHGDELLDRRVFQPEDKSSYSIEIADCKEKIKQIKPNIKNLPEIFLKLEQNIGEINDKSSSEKVSILGESAEQIVWDLCSALSVKVKSKSKVFINHDDLIKELTQKSGTPLDKVLHQTGFKHIFRINGSKKHHNYVPYSAEADYLGLCFWRGYCELLEIYSKVKS